MEKQEEFALATTIAKSILTVIFRAEPEGVEAALESIRQALLGNAELSAERVEVFIVGLRRIVVESTASETSHTREASGTRPSRDAMDYQLEGREIDAGEMEKAQTDLVVAQATAKALVALLVATGPANAEAALESVRQAVQENKQLSPERVEVFMAKLAEVVYGDIDASSISWSAPSS
ncbi:hypothetical protein FVE85_4445 [Porphyridium purpureum]|uniref:Uncharacterized protein n=1 Tax=Porphyridium purpureum TaxID=35688 RepID=A0A5J4YIC5_PORPP|nr:hypothetical protein FVE85_4445 [Porphyridium purpureum]|eukprot:POR5873..scf297_16